ncbi:hypothetical protein WJX72_003443 [[Myrmecia] bisecta]|uniref:Uncharacterized protein n=1 Tax=[Myrmecia] bisecta TaxID=41462 RepID=A0AAW1QEM4_9CHLO
MRDWLGQAILQRAQRCPADKALLMKLYKECKAGHELDEDHVHYIAVSAGLQIVVVSKPVLGGGQRAGSLQLDGTANITDSVAVMATSYGIDIAAIATHGDGTAMHGRPVKDIVWLVCNGNHFRAWVPGGNVCLARLAGDPRGRKAVLTPSVLVPDWEPVPTSARRSSSGSIPGRLPGV